MHGADFSLNMLGANGIVGAGIGPTTGTALASKLRGTDQVSVCFFGDGAAARGTFHEAITMGSLWTLPVVYVCENNGYQQWVPRENVAVVGPIPAPTMPFAPSMLREKSATCIEPPLPLQVPVAFPHNSAIIRSDFAPFAKQ
jgi:pyruvate dehydrogenase E1 component alpha subunit